MAPDLATFRSVISLISIPVYFVVAWVLYRRNLWRAYRYFWICLIVEGLALGATLLAGGARRPTLLIYKIAQPIMWVLYVLMVLEVFRKVFARFPGIARFAQRVVVLSMLVAFVFALLSVPGELARGWSGSSILIRYSVILRTITSALTLYMILIAAFLVWMPVPLPPNTIRHSYLFFFYFIITTGVHYVLNTNLGGYVQVANLTISILTLVALLSWLFLLREDGENPPTSPGMAPARAPSEILNRLESLNQSLTTKE